ncbi:MAG: tRNA (adenosine(37)-N6)-threonylcarbamoyltransferase complex transferase subunit TsaD [bacterium]
MIILAIDTSCDETSVAVVDGRRILSNVVSSQIRYHRKFGGVVPFLAQRLHKERIDSVLELAVERSGLSWNQIEAIAVTQGPGLAPALQVGIEKARDLSARHNLPLYAINHMAGHIASCLAQTGSRKPEVTYPALAVLVSGGHSELVLMKSFGDFQVIGETLDDALGEAYDKVAIMLGLGYPGGRLVAKLAKEGNPDAFPLPIAMRYSKDLNLSYSGLKNAVRLVTLACKEESGGALTATQINDICASFQNVAQQSLLVKVEKALKDHPEVSSILLAGGVAANAELRRRLRSLAKKYQLSFHVPANLKLCTDNAAMIGVAASLGIENTLQPSAPEAIDRKPGLHF